MAIRQQVITWTNVNLASEEPCTIHLMAIALELLMLLITMNDTFENFTFKIKTTSPKANELTCEMLLDLFSYFDCCHWMKKWLWNTNTSQGNFAVKISHFHINTCHCLCAVRWHLTANRWLSSGYVSPSRIVHVCVWYQKVICSVSCY